MKHILLTLSCAICINSSFAQSPTNPGFETWTGAEPDGWVTFNAVASGSVTQETAMPGSGTISAKINVVACPLCPIGGYPNPLPGIVTQRIATFARPAFCTFKWRGTVASGDTSLIGSFLTEATAPIGEAILQIPGPTTVSAWQTENIAYVYGSANNPDTLTLGALADQYLLLGWGGSSSTGTTIYVDDISFYGGTVGYDILETNNNLILAYPNPAQDIVNLNLLGTDATTLEVIDVTGKMVYSQNNLMEKMTLNVDGYQNGSYIVRFYNVKKEYIGSARFSVLK